MSLNGKFEYIHYSVFGYYCVTLLIFGYSVNAIIRFGLYKFFNVTIDIKTSIVYSILFIANFFYFTFDHIEAWWWFCASFHYLQGIVFLLFGIAVLIREKKNLIHYALIILSFMYAGASFEIYILIIFSLFISIILYCFFKKSDKTFQLIYKLYIKGFYIAFLSFTLSAIICFSAPGNLKRRSAWLNQNTSVSSGSSQTVFVQKKQVIAIGIACLWMILGMKLKKKFSRSIPAKQLKKAIAIAVIPLTLSIIITWSFQIFILGNTIMPLRGWTFISFTLTFFFSVLLLCIGCSVQIESLYLRSFIKILTPATIVVLLSWILIKQYGYTSLYAKEYDNLIGQLINAKSDQNTKTLFVKELPPSGMLIPLDIKDDYIKIPLKEILGLNYEIKVIE